MEGKTNMIKNKNALWELYNLDIDPFEKQYSWINIRNIKKLDQICFKEHMNSHIREWEFINPNSDLQMIYTWHDHAIAMALWDSSFES